jgi:CubicO group peptidase (beta-lactamase class C family)
MPDFNSLVCGIMSGAKAKAIVLLLIASSFPSAGAQTQPIPAERQFRAWLDAFNRGDRAQLLNFLESEFPARGATPNQQFRISAHGDGYYQFVARHTGKCVTLPPAVTNDHVQLEQRDCNGTAAQLFQLTLVTSSSPIRKNTPTKNQDSNGITNAGLYNILNKHSGKCVEAAAAVNSKGTVVQQNTCNETKAQLWQIVATDSGSYKIQTESDTTSGWDVGGKGDGSKIQIWRNVEDVNDVLSFRNFTGGFEFKKAQESKPTQFSGLLQERDSDQFVRFTIEVEPMEPHRIIQLDFEPAARPSEFAIPRLTESEFVTALGSKLGQDTAADKFSGAVLVVRNGKTLFGGAYGLADRDKRIPNTLNTRFRIGSMNKMFTATAILQLVQAGKIKLEDPIGKYLPDYPNKDIATKVTIHQLLTHTGGTGEIFGPQLEAHRLELKTLQDYVKLFGERGPSFEPGSKYAYSNYGFVLLGVIIERVSGVSYYDYVRDNIYKPAGMVRTGSQPEVESVPDRAIGYIKRDGNWKPNTDTLPYQGTSAGGGYSTVEDLVGFTSALKNNKVLNGYYTNLLTTGKVMSGESSKYAYGFEETIDQGIRYFGHGGGAPGVSGGLRIYPESGYVFVVLSNIDAGAIRISQFIRNRLPVKSQSIVSAPLVIETVQSKVGRKISS